MIKITCPDCRKEDVSELVNVLPGRRYEFKCKLCGKEFIIASGEPEGKKEKE